QPHFEHLLRDLMPQVLGSLIRRYGDLAAAEDAVQEASFAAVTRWAREGVPDNPRGWLIQVASRRLTDEVRRDVARRRRETESALETGYAMAAAYADFPGEGDDTLILLFMCCHPALTQASAIALTLRAVGGLNTAEIAKAFLVPEPTMAQRISRARQAIKESGVAFRMPHPSDEVSSIRSVLHVLYLIFNEGYAASAGESLQRLDLAAEAIRLTRLLEERWRDARRPPQPEIDGLLALMLLTHARRLARTSPDGEPIPLDKQDRTQWDRNLIAEGIARIESALAQRSVGPYQLQAMVAAVHDQATTAADTDWAQIMGLYELLIRIADSPVVRLNHAVAVAMARGPHEGLLLVENIRHDERLKNHHRVYAVLGHLHEMAGDATSALVHYRAAALKTASLPERNYLLAQAARLRGSTDNER
ncbi:MAG TPA: DUF6596 domain-containing protein, partial [Bryobacteraceae bacterium]|nr:DUF6596 domain-containing protein [Bryobacteraceae bacterium]